jgi:hypothetical protein
LTQQADELGKMYIVREDCKEFKTDRKGHQKKIHQILRFQICMATTCQHLATFVFVHSVFGAKFPTAEF